MLYITIREVTHMLGIISSMTKEEILALPLNDEAIATALKVRASRRDISEGRWVTPNWELKY